jgi:hypothetical protein
LHTSPNKRDFNSRRIRRWHVAHMGEMGNVYEILVGKPKGNRLLERLRCRQENDVGREIMWEGVY